MPVKHTGSRNCIAGEMSYGKPNILDFTGQYKLRIGKYCSISEGALFILDGNHHTEYVSTYPLSHRLYGGRLAVTGGDIVVGNDVWIGTQTVILPNVEIGDGAVVAAGCVVSKDVPPYAVVAGNPASVVKMRFAPEVIAELEAVKWWDWPKEKIKANVHLLEYPYGSEFQRLHSPKGLNSVGNL